MQALLILALIVLLIVFGCNSSAQSYATAQQAQAQIETARAAQISAAGNLVTILVMAAVVLVLLLAVLVVGWTLLRRPAKQTPARGASQPRTIQADESPAVNQDALGTLVQLMILEQLQSRRPQLPAQQDEQADEPLRRLTR